MVKEYYTPKVGHFHRDYEGVQSTENYHPSLGDESRLIQGPPAAPGAARGFNIFLPRGYKYRVEFSSPGEVVTIDDSDDDGFEMLETRTAEERVEAARARAEQQGDVVTLE